MKTMDVTKLSETYSTAYYNRTEDGIEILVSEYLEEHEDDYLSGDVSETLANLPSDEFVEYYKLTFTSKVRTTLLEWKETFFFAAEDYEFEQIESKLPHTKEQFSQLTDEQLFVIIVDYIAEIASVDWSPITFEEFFVYEN